VGSFAAAMGVLLLGVLNGMLAAIALSIAQLLYRWSHPVTSELGRVGSHDFVDLAHHDTAARIPGVAIWRPNAPLFFANAETVLHDIGHKARTSGVHVVILSLEESDDLDATALDALDEFAQGLHGAGCRLILARARSRVRDVLSAAGLAMLAENSTFSVADAATRATREETGDGSVHPVHRSCTRSPSMTCARPRSRSACAKWKPSGGSGATGRAMRRDVSSAGT
jgi:MFS superfamily sulfate permease-like transporter